MSDREIKKVHCGVCSLACPIDAIIKDGIIESVEGRKDFPHQCGGLCAKGAASKQYVYNK